MVGREGHRIALLPIYPRFALKIMSGEKRVEFRKVKFASDVTHIVVYATALVKKVLIVSSLHIFDFAQCYLSPSLFGLPVLCDFRKDDREVSSPGCSSPSSSNWSIIIWQDWWSSARSASLSSSMRWSAAHSASSSARVCCGPSW